MPNITNIVYNDKKEKYWIYVDGEFCASIRKRTFSAIKIKVGDEISCEKVKELENFHWKNAYNVKSWEKEKVRLNKVKKLIEDIDPKLKVNIVGFGADTTEYIKNHPEESGSPDIEVVINKSGVICCICRSKRNRKYERGFLLGQARQNKIYTKSSR